MCFLLPIISDASGFFSQAFMNMKLILKEKNTRPKMRKNMQFGGVSDIYMAKISL